MAMAKACIQIRFPIECSNPDKDKVIIIDKRFLALAYT